MAGDQVHGVHQQRRGCDGHGVIGPGRFGQGAGGGAAFQFGQGGAHRIGVGDSGQIGVGLEGATDVSQRLGVVAAQRPGRPVQEPRRRRRPRRRFGRGGGRRRQTGQGGERGAGRTQHVRPPNLHPACEAAPPAGMIRLPGDDGDHGFRHEPRRRGTEAAPRVRLVKQRRHGRGVTVSGRFQEQ